MKGELPAMEKWQKLAGEILDRTSRFPKSARFTFASRIDGIVLDVLDLLVLARYSSRAQKTVHLQQIDINLSRLLVLLRLSFERGFIGNAGYEYVCTGVVEVGSMIGGWRRSAVAAGNVGDGSEK